MVRYCPFCGSDRTHRSRRRLLERVISLMGRYPFRCEECQARFYAAWKRGDEIVWKEFSGPADAASVPAWTRDLSRLHQGLQAAGRGAPAGEAKPQAAVETPDRHGVWS